MFWIVFVILLLTVIGFVGIKMTDFALNKNKIGRFDERYLNDPESAPLSPWHEEGSETKKNIDRLTAQAQIWANQIKKEKIYISSADGKKLCALIIQNPISSHKWILGVHGYWGHKEEMFPLIKPFFEQGYNILLPDLKAHGESEGKYIGMGWPDRIDIKLWINEIVKRDNDAEVILYGISMGAACVMMTAGEVLPANVKAVIEDSGYTSVYDEFAMQLKQLFKLPAFPVIPILSPVMKIKSGLNVMSASALKAIKKCSFPILFIHGKDDAFVPVEMAHELYKAKSGIKQLHIVENCGHVGARYTENDAYYTLINEFITRYTLIC